MDAEEWARVFEAGWKAIPSRDIPAGDALGIALAAMQRTCISIHDLKLQQQQMRREAELIHDLKLQQMRREAELRNDG